MVPRAVRATTKEEEMDNFYTRERKLNVKRKKKKKTEVRIL